MCAPSRRRSWPRQRRWPTTTTSASTPSTGSGACATRSRSPARCSTAIPTDAEALLRVEIGEGFTGWVAEHGEPLLINDAHRRRARQDDRRDRGRPRVDAPGADAVRGSGPRRDRAQPARLQPLQHRRPADDEHLRRLRGAGDGQRDHLRPAGRAVDRAPTPSRVPAPPAGDERAPARHPRPGRRARDDRGRPARGGQLRQPVDLSDRSRARRDDAGPHPRATRRAGQPLHDPVRPRAHGLVGRARPADPGQRRAERPAGAADPGDAAGSGGGRGRAAHRGRRGARRAQRLARRAAPRSSSARATSSSSSCSPRRHRSRCATPIPITP